MKIYSLSLVAAILVTGSFISSCGKNDNNNNAAVNCGAGSVYVNGTCTYANGAYPNGAYPNGAYNQQTSCQGSCPVGQIQTANQCLPQGTCGPCLGQSGNSCLPGIYANGAYNGGGNYGGYGGYPGGGYGGYGNAGYGGYGTAGYGGYYGGGYGTYRYPGYYPGGYIIWN